MTGQRKRNKQNKRKEGNDKNQKEILKDSSANNVYKRQGNKSNKYRVPGKENHQKS